MAAKVALAALISLGLVFFGVATSHVVLAESTVSATASASSSDDCSGSASECEDAARSAHLAWNAASWLVGLALVVAVGRRRVQLGAD